jgi:hypothetical protein
MGQQQQPSEAYGAISKLGNQLMGAYLKGKVSEDEAKVENRRNKAYAGYLKGETGLEDLAEFDPKLAFSEKRRGEDIERREGYRAEDRALRKEERTEDRAFDLEQSMLQREQKQADIKSERDYKTSERLEAQEYETESKAKEESGDSKEKFNKAKDLRREFTKSSQDFIKVQDAFGRVQASAKDPSAAGDLALIFNYMKVLDPGSTVREGEFASAQNSGSVPDIIRAKYNKVRWGERLSSVIRDDFVNRAGSLYKEQLRGYEQTKGKYKELSESYGLKPERVVIDYARSFGEKQQPQQSGGAQFMGWE